MPSAAGTGGWQRLRMFALAGADALALLAALLAAVVLHRGLELPALAELNVWDPQRWWRGTSSLPSYLALAAVAVLRFQALGHYSGRKPFWDQLAQLWELLAILAVGHLALLSILHVDYSRVEVIGAWLLAALFMPAGRTVMVRLLTHAGLWQRPTVIVGCGPNAREAAAALREERFLGHEVVGFLALPGDDLPPSRRLEVGGSHVPVLEIPDDPVRVIRMLGSPAVVVAVETAGRELYKGVVRHLQRAFPNLVIVPPLRGLPLYGMEISHFFRHEVLLLNVRNNLARPGSRMLKRAFDIAGAAVLLVLTAPLFAWLTWELRKTGPAYFGHRRVGERGREFRCYKFRTMVPNADEVLAELLRTDPEARAEWEKDFKLRNDPRVTRLGAFLRKTSLDELPQLWNVLRGDMSLVGPRPIVRAEMERYREDLDYYLGVRPGITGLWQVSGRNDVDYASRVQLDAWYVRNWSLWYDIVILMQTLRVVLRRDGAY